MQIYWQRGGRRAGGGREEGGGGGTTKQRGEGGARGRPGREVAEGGVGGDGQPPPLRQRGRETRSGPDEETRGPEPGPGAGAVAAGSARPVCRGGGEGEEVVQGGSG